MFSDKKYSRSSKQRKFRGNKSVSVKNRDTLAENALDCNSCLNSCEKGLDLEETPLKRKLNITTPTATPTSSRSEIKLKDLYGELNKYDSSNDEEFNDTETIFAMRCVGGGLADLETYCGLMNLPPPVEKSSYKLINSATETAVITAQSQSMNSAAKIEFNLAEVPAEYDLCRNIDASIDGIWMTRGHTSQCGQFMLDFFNMKDHTRMIHAQQRISEASLEARRLRRKRKLGLEESRAESKGFPYLAGAH
ncbi:hypothetical protein Btru_062474 [Bulinus truncatus]|nr:hypothetical protein Btru_062474 [Bulinus truncatus]